MLRRKEEKHIGTTGILTKAGDGMFKDVIYRFPDGTIIDGTDVSGVEVRMKGGNTTSPCAANWTYTDEWIENLLKEIRRKTPRDTYLVDPTILVLDDDKSGIDLFIVSIPAILEEHKSCNKFGFVAQYGNGHWIYVNLANDKGGFRLDIYDSLAQSNSQKSMMFDLVREYMQAAGINITNFGEKIEEKFHIPKLQNADRENPSLHCGAYALDCCEELVTKGEVDIIRCSSEDGDKVSMFLRARDVVRLVKLGKTKSELTGVVNYDEVKAAIDRSAVVAAPVRLSSVDAAGGGAVVVASRAVLSPHSAVTAASGAAIDDVAIKAMCAEVFKFLEVNTNLASIGEVEIVLDDNRKTLIKNDKTLVIIRESEEVYSYEGDDVDLLEEIHRAIPAKAAPERRVAVAGAGMAMASRAVLPPPVVAKRLDLSRIGEMLEAEKASSEDRLDRMAVISRQMQELTASMEVMRREQSESQGRLSNLMEAMQSNPERGGSGRK